MRRSILILSVCGLLVACQGEAPALSEPLSSSSSANAGTRLGLQGGGGDWRLVATAEDASRLGRIDQAWRLARAEADAGGFASEIEALGVLVDPNAALPGRLQPPPGDYRCRTFKIGSASGAEVVYVAYPWFRCTVELTVGGDLILTKATGSQRTQGLLYPDTDRRLVFVGAQAFGSRETGFPGYGEQADRDQIGVLERIGEQRWRLVLPWPRWEAKLELVEMRR